MPKGKKPKHPMKGRPGLATVLGRAVVLDDYFKQIADPKTREAAASDIGVTLSPADLAAINEIDWVAAGAAVGTLRDLLPDLEGPPKGVIKEDAAGW